MPDSGSSEHAVFVAYTPAVKTASLKTGGPSRRQLPKTTSLVVEKGSPGIRWFTCPGGEMAFTGLAFDPNHVSGDYEISLLTVTEIVIRVIPLSRSISAVMFCTKKTTGTVTSKRPDSRLEVSMPPEKEGSMTDNVLWSEIPLRRKDG